MTDTKVISTYDEKATLQSTDHVLGYQSDGTVKVFPGTAFSGGGSGSRTQLLADTTYYVRSAGSDSNDGTSSGSAWQTLQHAMNVISAEIDLAGFVLTIDIGAGSFVGFGIKSTVGGGVLFFNGAGSASTTITNGPNDGLFNYLECISCYFPCGSLISIDKVKLSESALDINNILFAAPVLAVLGNYITFSGADIIFDCQNTGGAILLDQQADLQSVPGTYVLQYSGAGLTNDAAFMGYGGSNFLINGNWTVTGTPNYTHAFLYLAEQLGGNVSWSSPFATFSGSATGLRFRLEFGASVYVGSNGLTYFPGNASGTLDLSSSYNNVVAPRALTIGSTSITSGTNTRVLYDNAGTVGEAASFTINAGQPDVPLSKAYLYDGINMTFAVDPGGGLALNWFLGGAGNMTLTGDGNFCEGPGAGAAITTGRWNMAQGAGALAALNTGSSIVAIGRFAANAATSLSDSVAIGTGALQTATTGGSSLLAIGTNALGSGTLVNATGIVAIGPNAGNQVTGASSFAVLIGESAGNGATSLSDDTIIGSRAAQSITASGGNNTIIGASTAVGLTTGTTNTFIGRSINVGNVSYNIVITRGDGLYGFRYDGNLGTTGGFTLTGDDGLKLTCPTFMIRTTAAYNNGAAAAAGTLTNAPAAGNPTKWIPVDDNGTTRYIPAW